VFADGEAGLRAITAMLVIELLERFNPANNEIGLLGKVIHAHKYDNRAVNLTFYNNEIVRMTHMESNARMEISFQLYKS
jgi:hypothetical protein